MRMCFWNCFFCIFGIGTDGHFEIRNLVVTYRGERAEPLGWPLLLYPRRLRNPCLGHVVKRKRPVPRDLVKALSCVDKSNLELQRPKTHRFAPKVGITKIVALAWKEHENRCDFEVPDCQLKPQDSDVRAAIDLAQGFIWWRGPP